ncbi:CapA family protein [Tissierella creatinini]|nr:CapA family protein [Tissierella creatinini]TJX61066.1 CapA family protein [Soehngenia saccharolytica]
MVIMNIVICGDICPTTNNYKEFINEQSDVLFGKTKDFITNADFAIANLECPLIDNGTPIFKSGPSLKAPSKSIATIKQVGFDAVSIANNHIMDYGEEGLNNTVRLCNDFSLLTVGAGLNSLEAAKPLYYEKNNVKVGIISYTDNEFGVSTLTEAGSNGLDLLYSFDNISNIKNKCDYLIILYHSGTEHYPYPSPQLQCRCRKMVESGANLVVCQHSHCIGTIETYDNSTIIYGQGNFLFSRNNKSKKWNTGIIIELELDEFKNGTLRYLPTIIDEIGVDFATESEKEEVLIQIRNRSNEVANTNVLHKYWIQYCNNISTTYWSFLLGHSKLKRIFNKVFKNIAIRINYNNNKALLTHNIIRCESHREILETMLSSYYRKR